VDIPATSDNIPGTLVLRGATGDVKIGIASPAPPITAPLTVNAGPTAGAALATYTYGSVNPGVVNLRANGTVENPTQVLSGERFAFLVGGTYGTTGFGNNPAAMNFYAAENQTDTARGSFITFDTCAVGQSGRQERLRIDASGNVGIGMTPSYRVDVSSGDEGWIQFRHANTTTAGSGAPGSSTGAEFISARGDGNGTFASRIGLAFRRADGTSIQSGVSLGGVTFGGQHGSDATFQSSKVLYSASIHGVSEGVFNSATDMPTALVFRTGSVGQDLRAANLTYGTERMRIDGSGNVLIGATSTSNSVSAIQATVNDGYGRLLVKKTTAGAVNGLLFYHNGSYVGGLNYDNSSTSLVTSSDARLKKDIVEAAEALSDINRVRIVSHGWKNDDATVRYGAVAQELADVFPEAVAVGDDSDEISKVWGVDYVRLIPALIKAVQELTAKVEALEAAQ
jgi:hypothetical protein